MRRVRGQPYDSGGRYDRRHLDSHAAPLRPAVSHLRRLCGTHSGSRSRCLRARDRLRLGRLDLLDTRRRRADFCTARPARDV